MQLHSVKPQTQDLVLIGGGHSHLTVIKQLGMHPIAGLRVTLISKDIHTPYSGMLPGLIAGHYTVDEAHIDLRRLCQAAGVRLFHSEVNRLDLDQQQLFCHNRPPVRYDYLSINTGSQPALQTIPGSDHCGIAVKPIAGLLSHWQQFIERCKTEPCQRRVAIVGGGAASVEIALACHYQLQQSLDSTANQIQLSLLCGSDNLLPSHNRRVQRFMAKKLADRSIRLTLNQSIVRAETLVDGYRLTGKDGRPQLFDEVIWAIHAGSPQWPQQSGLACDEQGFISVNHYLQSLSHSNVFAAGDIAHFEPRPIAKSGVYAVRAGRQLSENLRRFISGQPLQRYRPQKRFLSLLMTGDQQAIASKGALSIAGRWVWRWKDAIDRQFIARFNPASAGPSDNTDTAAADTSIANTSLPSTPVTDAMRCGGCGAKIGHSVLNRVMQQLDCYSSIDVAIGLNAPDDAALINPPAGKQWLQTVDYFRAFIDDPYLLGYIATNHCLSDIYAMGGAPHSALAIATIPYAHEALVEDTLLQLMRGAVDSLNQQHTALIGGHSSEGAELGFGLSVNGTIDRERSLTKTGLAAGDCLILTKPLGSGILLASNNLSEAQGRWITAALQTMQINNRAAAAIAFEFGANACTDITGFGLAGHLREMLSAGTLHARLELAKLPALSGALYCASQGWLSSLHADNQRFEGFISNCTAFAQQPHYPLLFDPQTAGGLLLAIPKAQAKLCVAALHAADCPEAAIIGYIDDSAAAGLITLV